jgi:cytochrome P450/NADPH-cytochrome P450 reductase
LCLIYGTFFLGQGLSDENIRAQLITFLVAGHETTSGMLSFAMGHIVKHPEVYSKVRQEVDTVVGKDPIKPEHLSKLTYINGKPFHPRLRSKFDD